MAWISTNFPGVRYREHATRKVRGQADRYYTLRYRVNGQRKEEPIGWASEGWNPEKAYKVLAKILEGVRTGEGPQSLAEKREAARAAKEAEKEETGRAKLADMTLHHFFTHIYTPRVMKEKRTWKTDVQRINKSIVPVLGAFPLLVLQKQDVQNFLDSLASAGAAPATIKQYMAIIRHAYNIAADTVIDGIPLFSGQNPAKGVRIAPVHNSRERYLTAAEVDSLLAEAAMLRSPDLHDAIILSLNTGLRLGEMLRLRWLDVDLSVKVLSVPDEAQRKPGGKVPINNAALAVFLCRKEWAHGKPEEKVFVPYGRGARRENISHAFREVASRVGLNAGIEDVRNRVVFHTLRHTFASWLALSGVDIYRIKALMRHRTITMTMRYAHLIPDATRDAVHNLRPPSR